MKKSYIALFTIIGIAAVFYLIVYNSNRKEPVVYVSHGLLRELSMNEKIQEAQLIIIGEVTNKLPSKWTLQHQKDAKNASPQEVLREGGLFTDYLVKVDEILKGNSNRTKIRVRSFSGETDLVRWEGGSEPNYEIGQTYLFFLVQDYGPTTIVDAGDYISVNANTAVYKIHNGNAASADDEWDLEELIAYIQNKLVELQASPAPPTDVPTETATEPFPSVTPTLEETSESTETPLPAGTEEETPTPTPDETITPAP